LQKTTTLISNVIRIKVMPKNHNVYKFIYKLVGVVLIIFRVKYVFVSQV